MFGMPQPIVSVGSSPGRLFNFAERLTQPCHSTNTTLNELVTLLDGLPDALFFLKDIAGRYTYVNLTVIRRLGLKDRKKVIGRTPEELYPAPFGQTYVEQDQQVLRGATVENLLELQLFPNRAPGWCLTHKRPLYENGAIIGLVGISRDLDPQSKNCRQPIYAGLRTMVEYLQNHYTENLRVHTLAEQAGMSLPQLERHFKRVFQLTPKQMLIKLRIELAIHLLRKGGHIAEIGMVCGFADQSAFTRQFKAVVGMTPKGYRGFINRHPIFGRTRSRA